LFARGAFEFANALVRAAVVGVLFADRDWRWWLSGVGIAGVGAVGSVPADDAGVRVAFDGPAELVHEGMFVTA
jgi:hypothetical protein